MIKLIALDLDGTLLNSQGQLSPQNRDAIRAAEEAGVIVTIATGRRFRDARPVGLDLALNGPMITHNGALLKFASTLETTNFSLIGHDTALDIIRLGKKLGGDALVSTDPHGHGTMLYDTISDDNAPLQKYLLWANKLHGGGADAAVRHVDALEDVIASEQIIHISFSGTCERMRAMQMMLETELDKSVTVLATIYPRQDFTLIDILPPESSKGHGLGHLARTHGFARDEVMAIGDNYNDLEMLAYAGTPVVMGNADPELLGTLEFNTTLSNDEHGVAAAIDRFVLTTETIRND